MQGSELFGDPCPLGGEKRGMFGFGVVCCQAHLERCEAGAVGVEIGERVGDAVAALEEAFGEAAQQAGMDEAVLGEPHAQAENFLLDA